jgi:pimeloyl-ACP methyl ester carboxylesterase
MQAGLKNAYESIKAFSETDQTDDLRKFDVPTLVLRGEDDQIVPVKDSAKKSARLIEGAKEIYSAGFSPKLTLSTPSALASPLDGDWRGQHEAARRHTTHHQGPLN